MVLKKSVGILVGSRSGLRVYNGNDMLLYSHFLMLSLLITFVIRDPIPKGNTNLPYHHYV